MKPKILIALLLLSSLTKAQTDRENRKATETIAKSHIKSCTQTAYNYVYDLQSGTRKPSTKGIKVASCTYDSKGNPIQSIDYDNYGNVNTRTTSKFDDRGNPIEVIVYGSDGIMQTKKIMEYHADTVTRIKQFTPDGKLGGTAYGLMFSGLQSRNTMLNGFLKSLLQKYIDTFLIDPGNLYHTLGIYSSADSSLIAIVDYIYDSRGNLILQYSFGAKYMVSGETYKYNSLNQRVENNHYDDVDDWKGDRQFKYDEMGNVIETTQIGFNGLLISTTTYKNDAKGNCLEFTAYDSNNVPQQVTKYSYQYFQ